MSLKIERGGTCKLGKKNLIWVTAYLFLSLLLTGGCSDLPNKATMTKLQYPEKPITVIVPFSVGGGLDLAARSLEKLAPKYLGQPLVVLNKPGGAGAIGWNELSGASPDGYTIGITGMDMLLLPLYGPTKYNYPTALDPLVQIASSSMAMAVQSDQPWQNIDELIEYAKKHPGQLKFGHSGIGSFNHVLGEMFGQAAGITIEQVPFTGGGEMAAALLGGHIQLIFVNPMIVKEHVKNGTIRVLAVTGEQRMIDPIFAQVPTFNEQGLAILLTNWFGVAAPKEMPDEVKNKLAEGLKAIVTDPEFIKNMTNAGLQVAYLGPKESQFKWLSDNEKLTKIINETDVLDKIKAQKK
jgi:tripartite-type tricarboxylate transporter receptor subunit TctC